MSGVDIVVWGDPAGVPYPYYTSQLVSVYHSFYLRGPSHQVSVHMQIPSSTEIVALPVRG